MITIMLSAHNLREHQILQTAFTQYGIVVNHFKPHYSFYIKMLQFIPDVVVMEFPPMNSEHIHFVSLIKKHKKLKNVKIIGYGDNYDQLIMHGIQKCGILKYFGRPLKFSMLMSTLNVLLKQAGKETTGAKSTEDEKYTEIKLLLNTDTLPTKKIAIMVKYVAQLMAFPFVVAKVLKLAEDNQSGAGDLSKVIKADPVISTNLLKVSNTVFFAAANRSISSVKDAIVRVGFRETKRIVMSMAIMSMFKNENKNSGFDRVDFWYHSLTTGIIAERLAKRLGSVNVEDAFLAGLLHDFGIILFDNYFPDIFMQVLEKTADQGALFIDKEVAMLGIHHNDVVAELFTKWKMPTEISHAIVQQYDFYKWQDKVEVASQRLGLCIGIANIIAKSICLGSECDQFVRPIDNWALELCKMPAGINKEFIDDVVNDVVLYRQFLKLEERDFLKTPEGMLDAETIKVGFLNQAKAAFVPAIAYLEKQGIAVDRMKLTDKASVYDQKFTVLIIWADDSLGAQQLGDYCHVVKLPAAGDVANKPLFVPLLVITNNAPLATAPELKHISFMPKCFDLRMLDRAIMEMAEGKVVGFVPYEETEIKETHAEPDQADAAAAAAAAASDNAADPEGPPSKVGIKGAPAASTAGSDSNTVPSVPDKSADSADA